MSTAILVHSKDCNRELTELCLNQINRYITHCLDIPVYVSTELVPLKTNIATNILTGDGFWSDRLKVALENIKEENIIFFLEDVIITNVESIMTLCKCISFHELNYNNMTKLGNHVWFGGVETASRIDNYKIFVQEGGLYVMSHRPITIFNKKFLYESLKPEQTPWQHEGAWVNLRPVPDKIFIIGNDHNYVEHEKEGIDLGEIVEYHHALSKGERIQYVGKYKI